MCRDCELRFLIRSKRLPPAEEAERYQMHTPTLHDEGYLKFIQPLISALASVITAPGQGLDFGAGQASGLSRHLRERGHTMTLYDPLFWPAFEPLERLGFYDFVVTCEVVEHLREPRVEFERLHSLLRPGGWLAVMTHLYAPPQNFADWYYRRDPTHIVFYSAATFRWMAHHLRFADLRFSGPRTILLRRPL